MLTLPIELQHAVSRSRLILCQVATTLVVTRRVHLRLSRRNGGSGSELPLRALPRMSWVEKPEDAAPGAGQHSRQFGAGCFGGVELAFHRAADVTRVTRACEPRAKNHCKVVRVHYDPYNCKYQRAL